MIKLFESFKMFSDCVGKHRKREVTIVFTYSHLNTPTNENARTIFTFYKFRYKLFFLALIFDKNLA